MKSKTETYFQKRFFFLFCAKKPEMINFSKDADEGIIPWQTLIS